VPKPITAAGLVEAVFEVLQAQTAPGIAGATTTA